MSDSEKNVKSLTKKSKTEKNVAQKSKKGKKRVKSCKTRVQFKKTNINNIDDLDCMKIQDCFGEFGLDLSWTLPNIQENISNTNEEASMLDFSGSYDLKLFCKSYVKPKPLLLAYTYFLNNEYTKYISIGYQQDDFKTGIVLHDIGENCVVLSSFDWLSLFIYITEIDCAFSEQKLENPINVTSELILKYNVPNNCIIVSKDSAELKITRGDWQIFVQLTEYFSFVLNWYNQTSAIAKNYYDEYVAKCIENNLPYLNSSHYFSPKNCNKNCNFSRLFYEIGIINNEK